MRGKMIYLPELELEFELGDTELQFDEFKSEFIRFESQFGAIRPLTKPPNPWVCWLDCGKLFSVDIGVLALQFCLLKLSSEVAKSICCSKSVLHNRVSSLSIVKCSPLLKSLAQASQRKQFTWKILELTFIT